MKHLVHLAVTFGFIAGFVSFACADQSKLEQEFFENQPSVDAVITPLPTIGIDLSPKPTPSPIQNMVTPTPLSVENGSPDNSLEPAIPINKIPPIFEGKRGGTLRLISKHYFDSLDPHENYSGAHSTWGIGIIYQRLLKFSNGPDITLPSKSTECDACSSWQMVDNKTFIFDVDTNIKWVSEEADDMNQLLPEDIKFSLDRQMAKNQEHSNRFHMVRSVDVKSENQIQINLNVPDADFFISLADGRSKLLSKSDINDPGKVESAPPIGSGPWRLSKLVDDSYSSVENVFSAPNPPYLDSIEFHIITDPQARLSAYSVGLIDVYNIENYSTELDIALENPEPGLGFEIAFNTAKPPFKDAHTRVLARSSINPNEIIQKAWHNYAFFSLGFVTNHSSWIPVRSDWESYFYPSQHPETLKEIIPISIATSDFGSKYKESAEIASKQLEAVGFEPIINFVNRRQYAEKIWGEGDFDVLMGPTFPQSSTNSFVIPVLHSEGKWNTSNHRDMRLDELIEEQSQEYNLEKRSEIINEMNRHLLEKSYRFMPATQKSLWAWTEDLKNMHPNFSGLEYSHWERVWLDR
ncbi:MAG: ABC transporter substrate-binding protein [SAR202 cluster bacterium]|jgi:ABC-type transport system substrate-binding protein|nr:ABC transporter substrate-binding protein [SAR202 cluster bacterium]HJO59986.1 ABC transporter substrate-binding protein [SAR202 cluster bacterium]|tara:strand:- start:4657 stop:6393 length:1737 start_codon:yes stop_codon:yes gene_type:complete